MASLPIEIQELLKNHKCFKVLENGKIQCQLSGHEIPCRLDAIKQYISGKKYQQLAKKMSLNLSEYKEHLEPNKKKGREHQLYCKLTRKSVNNTADGIQIHISGQKFQRTVKQWKLCQETGKKFIYGGKPQRVDDDNNEQDGWETDDSLDDLYPEEDFENLNLNDEEEEKKPAKKRQGNQKLMKSHHPVPTKKPKLS